MFTALPLPPLFAPVACGGSFTPTSGCVVFNVGDGTAATRPPEGGGINVGDGTAATRPPKAGGINVGDGTAATRPPKAGGINVGDGTAATRNDRALGRAGRLMRD